MKVRAILFDHHGDPVEVSRCDSVDLPGLSGEQVLVRMVYAPINPADLNMIQGSYATKPPLPAVPGGEGLGVVEEIGDSVADVAVGDYVVLPAGQGTWRERLVVAARDVISVPADLPHEQAAMLRVNPATAYRMLHDFVPLRPGEWVLQNAANSGVGRSAIQIAGAKGWRTINVVRREELVAELKGIGADVVLVDSPDLPERIAEVTGGESIRLALNAVGGESAMRLAHALGASGTHVTYGAMSRQPVRIPNGLLIFKDLRFRGFWVTQWYRDSSREQLASMMRELIGWVKSGTLFTPVDATFSLDQVSEALRRASEGSRAGKVLFRM